MAEYINLIIGFIVAIVGYLLNQTLLNIIRSMKEIKDSLNETNRIVISHVTNYDIHRLGSKSPLEH